MARLNWALPGTRFFETGISQGVLYAPDTPGVAWIGLTSVSEHPSGGDANAYYLDGVKYLNVPSYEEFAATITAYTYPAEFDRCLGKVHAHPGLLVTGQRRRSFGFSYRTEVGNDLKKTDYGYKIHLVYNALAAPSNRSFKSLGGDINAVDFSWDITTKPPSMSGYKRTAHIVIDSSFTNPTTMSTLEDIIYGSDATAPRLPELAELITVFNDLSTFSVIDHGDGSFSISGPEPMVHPTGPDSYELMADSIVSTGPDSYTASSM